MPTVAISVGSSDVSHLPGVPASLDALPLQVADHGRAVDAVLPGETVDGLPVYLPGADLVDLLRRQPTLLLSGTPGGGNVLLLGGSADHLLKGSAQFVFRE